MNRTSDLENRDVLLARYRENADQARHHELLRERSTAMVAATTGVLLGLAGFKGGANPSQLAPLVGLFIALLGFWGIYSSIVFERRARRHRDRIVTLLLRLGEDVNFPPRRGTLNFVWILFHLAIIAVGITLFCQARSCA